MSKSEARIQSECLLALNKLGVGRFWRQNTGAAYTRDGRMVRFGLKGAADISGVVEGGRRVELEVKTQTGRLRPEQEKYGAMLCKWGAVWAVVRSADEAVSVVLASLGRDHVERSGVPVDDDAERRIERADAARRDVG